MKHSALIKTGIVAAGLLGTVALSAPRRARAQQTMQVGGVHFRAPHSEVDFTTNEIILSGGVTITSDNGYNVDANRVVFLTGRNPATGKSDVKSATADGNVRVKAVTMVNPSANGQAAKPYKRVINASADHGELRNFLDTVVLTGNVNVVSDDPFQKTTWDNAATATIVRSTKKLVADGPQMNMHFQPKGNSE